MNDKIVNFLIMFVKFKSGIHWFCVFDSPAKDGDNLFSFWCVFFKIFTKFIFELLNFI